MVMPSDDQTIVYRIITEVQQALDDVASFRQQIDLLKAKMRELQKASGESFNTISASMKNAMKEGIGEIKNQIDVAKEKIRTLKAEISGLGAAGATPGQLLGKQEELKQQLELLSQLRTSLKQANQDYTQFGRVSTSAVKELNAETKQLASSNRDSATSFKNLAGALFGVYGVIQLVGAALRTSINLMKEFLELGLRYTKAVFQLEVGVRALRRVGVDISFQDVVTNLQQINNGLGNLFSNLELIEGAAAFTNLIRDLGLTKDQILEMQKAVATLAVVNGRSMEDVQRTVALALSSGYTEGLQRLGVSINRLTIAEEANRMGFKGGYVALTEQQRALATYNILIQKTSVYTDDMAKAQETLFGSIQKSTAEIENFKAQAGATFLPLKATFLSLVASWTKVLNVTNPLLVVLRSIAGLFELAGAAGRLVGSQLSKIFDLKIIDTFGKGLVNIKNGFMNLIPPSIFTMVNKYLDFWKDVRKEIKLGQDEVKKFLEQHPNLLKFIQDFMKIRAKVLGQSTDDLTFDDEVDLGTPTFNLDQDKLLGMLEDQFGDIAELEKESAEKRKKLNEDLQSDMIKIEQDGALDRLKIQQDYVKDVAKLQSDLNARIQAVVRDSANRLREINIKLKFNIDEAKLRFDFDVAEVQRKYQEDVSKAQEEYRQKELERERKYQEELLRIREDYLMDLEDALENRDARAVLRAVREFRLNKDRAKRENELGKISDKEKYEQELKDLARRREARIRELKFELQQRIAELQRNAQFEREELARRTAEELAELQRKHQAEKEERAKAYQDKLQEQKVQEMLEKSLRMYKHAQDLAQIKTFEEEKLKLIGAFLAEQGKLLGLSYKEIENVTNTFFGPGGTVLSILKQFKASWDAIMATFGGKARPNVNQRPNVIPNQKSRSSIPFAEGGAMIARQPTTAVFGERTPEAAIFAPLNKIDQLSSLLGGFSPSMDTNGSLRVAINLSPGLEAKIVDQALNGVADVIIEKTRAVV